MQSSLLRVFFETHRIKEIHEITDVLRRKRLRVYGKLFSSMDSDDNLMTESGHWVPHFLHKTNARDSTQFQEKSSTKKTFVTQNSVVDSDGIIQAPSY